MTFKQIKKSLQDLNLWSDSMIYAVNSLVEVDAMITSMIKDIKKEGRTSTEVTREGNDRLVLHPLISEVTKLESVKEKLLNSLLLTPAALHKANISMKDKDAFDDIKGT